MENQIKSRLSQAVESRVFPGCVVGIVKKSGERTVIPFGNFTYDSGSRAMESGSVFDIASVTKSIPTSSLALKLLEDGRLKLENKISDFLPVSDNPDMADVSIKHLLTHTLDWGFRLSEMKGKPREEILRTIFSAKLKNPPGTTYFYSNATSILLGLIVKKIYGNTLDNLGKDIFFSPLGMEKTTFHPLEILSKEEIVPTEIQEWRPASASDKRDGLVQGEVHDESAYSLKEPVGSAGVFSCVPDLLNFMEMLLNGGELNGKRYFSENTIEKIQTDYGAEVGERDNLGEPKVIRIGLGWELNQPWYMGTNSDESVSALARDRSAKQKRDGKRFGKTGFTGCSCVCDTELETALVILSNRVYPARKQNSADINEVRRDIADIVFTS